MQVTFYGVRGSAPAPGPTTVRYGGNTVCVEVLLSDGSLLILAHLPKEERAVVLSHNKPRIARQIGYPVIYTSTKQGQGLDALRARSPAAWMNLFDQRWMRSAWPYGSGDRKSTRLNSSH